MKMSAQTINRIVTTSMKKISTNLWWLQMIQEFYQPMEQCQVKLPLKIFSAVTNRISQFKNKINLKINKFKIQLIKIKFSKIIIKIMLKIPNIHLIKNQRIIMICKFQKRK